jgi:hypothetical protein
LPDAVHPVETPQFDAVDWFRELLPIELNVEKGSVVLGSDATPMVLIGDFRRADGTMEISNVSVVPSQADSSLDRSATGTRCQ